MTFKYMKSKQSLLKWNKYKQKLSWDMVLFTYCTGKDLKCSHHYMNVVPINSHIIYSAISLLGVYPRAAIFQFTCSIPQFSSDAQSCPTFCDPMSRSTPGLPVQYQLPEFTQIHVYRVGDAIQPSHLLSSPSPPAPNPSQHQSLFQWVNSSHEVRQSIGVSASTSVLPMNTQDWSPLGWTGWTSLQSKGLSRVFSNTTVQKHQFFSAQPSSQSNSHIHTWPLEKP